LTGHTNQVIGVAYSANGKLLASGSKDKTVRLWEVLSGECRAVVEHFPAEVLCVSWSASSDPDYLVTGCHDGSVLKWQVIEEGDQYRVQLQWSISNGGLTVTGASIQDAHGLTSVNKQLLLQRGAIGESKHLLRETSKRLIAMASVVSKF
jgi:WD40 repeat protein